ncbi:hypothetical protein EYE40_10085 [Glaciihabitans arcticus]|uniref:CHY-type domain-containing protein n=1 Tax=Glaciihabitans arcticus TaxID=2668039 RepID=A0A4Q9GVT6_9MICO|nr:CHY zinc finger protein [Glaciihabitans arcticus]TBN57708.1 hypothetical protein EYE40_10085 [Glaciihabitans arcticus]
MQVLGQTVDDQTRCVHWSGPTDVVALRFACCDAYYPCSECHDSAGHPAALWPRSRFGEPAVLCGVCRHELTVDEYLAASACPHCSAAFNPGCALHHHLYFEGFSRG